MAEIPASILRQLFDENKDKTWPGFRRALTQRKSRGEDSVIDELLAITLRMEMNNETFPISAEQLQRALERTGSKVIA